MLRQQPRGSALPSPRWRGHIRRMAKTPDKPDAPKPKGPKRDPAKHSKKDPAKPTRAKAARPDLPPIEPALANLLNPAITRGEAGPGSGTGLKPPPDNSFDRRADFAAAHTARKSTPKELRERPQSGYVGKGPDDTPPVEINSKLAQALGYRVGDSDNDEDGDLAAPSGVTATARALERLLREGRPEFAAAQDGAVTVWTPHRPPRPEKSEGGQRLVIKSDFEPKGDQPQAIDELVEGVNRHDRNQVLLG